MKQSKIIKGMSDFKHWEVSSKLYATALGVEQKNLMKHTKKTIVVIFSTYLLMKKYFSANSFLSIMHFIFSPVRGS
jgi:hypothetical protein